MTKIIMISHAFEKYNLFKNLNNAMDIFDIYMCVCVYLGIYMDIFNNNFKYAIHMHIANI